MQHVINMCSYIHYIRTYPDPLDLLYPPATVENEGLGWNAQLKRIIIR